MIRTPIGQPEIPSNSQNLPNAQIIASTEAFYKETYRESYEMQSPDQFKGLAIIVSVIKFENSQFPERSGGEIDLRFQIIFRTIFYRKTFY